MRCIKIRRHSAQEVSEAVIINELKLTAISHMSVSAIMYVNLFVKLM